MFSYRRTMMLGSLYLVIMLFVYSFVLVYLYTSEHQDRVLRPSVGHASTAFWDIELDPNLNSQTCQADNTSFGHESFKLASDYVHFPWQSDHLAHVNTLANKTIYLYKAFREHRNTTTIHKVLALVDRSYCSKPSALKQMWTSFRFFVKNLNISKNEFRFEIRTKLKDGEHVETKNVAVQLECLAEDHEKQFVAVLFTSQLDDASYNAHAILDETIVLKYCVMSASSEREHASQEVHVHLQPQPNEASDKELIVCVRPFFGTLNLLNLLEFLAYYRFQGISRFQFFHNNITHPSSGLNQTLQFIGSLPGVTLTPLSLPPAVASNVHANGQILCMHTCLFQYADSIQLHVDIDELVQLGTADATLCSWARHRLAGSATTSALYILNLFHCHEFNRPHSQYYEFRLPVQHLAVNLASRSTGARKAVESLLAHIENDGNVQLTMFLYNNYVVQRTPWPVTIRSKVIVLRPEMIRVMGIHQAWSFTTSSQDVWQQVPPTEASLHHYRLCCDFTQTYFFDLLRFSTVDDVDRDKLVSRSHQPFHSDLFRNISSFIVQHFCRYRDHYLELPSSS